MSLFGDSPTNSPVRPKNSASLFDDTPASRNSGSLFADDQPGDAPWGFASTKRAARGTLIKTLLPASDVPEMYIDVFDQLSTGNTISPETVKKILSESDVDEESTKYILSIVSPDESKQLGRGETNVLLALIGLVQEGEEPTLDGVDERRRNLPIPKLGSLAVKPDPKPEPEPVTPAPVERPTPVQPQESSPKPQSTMPKTFTRRSFGPADADPWASPNVSPEIQPRERRPTNGTQKSLPPATRTTGSFTTTAQQATSAQGIPPAQESGGREGSWEGFGSGGGNSFPDAGFGGSGFGEAAGGDGPQQPTGLEVPFAPRILPSGAEEVITVTTLPEKEGMFLFQHRNYQVSSARRNSKVIRRYSDFVWLLDCLHKRYPFRQLPLLPPKRVAINGNYLAADAMFVEKRRRGLARFANALVRHPVLCQEQLVVMFLTVPTELAVWRKQAAISVQEEFSGKTLPATLEDSLPPNLQVLFDRVRTGVRRSSEQYINLCNNLERMIKRNEGMAAEYSRIAMSLQTLNDVSADTYAADTGDMVALNMGLTAASKHYSAAQSLLDDEGRAWDEGVLEDLKKQRDAMVSMRDLFDRKDRLDRNNIPQLEKRILNNEARLDAIRAKPEIKPGEIEKVEDAIVKDKQSIVDQHARGVFIKECVRDEIGYFQSLQFQISRLHQDWAAERVKYAELQADNWRALADEVESMPLGES